MSNVKSELRALLRLAWPTTVAQAGMPLLGLVDMAIVGRVSVTDLAGAALGRTIGFAAILLALGATMGLEPLASQAIGARDPVRAWQAMRTTVKAAAALWAPSMACGLAFTYALEPFGVSHEVTLCTRAYLLGQAPGLLLYCGNAAIKVFLQAHGKTRAALVAVIAANVANLVVCNVLVRGDDFLRDLHLQAIGLPRLGAAGAGLASSIASLLLLGLMLRAARLHRPAAAGPPVRMAAVLSLGMPIGLLMLAVNGVFTLSALLAGTLGKETAAAYQVVSGLVGLTYNGALGIASATAVRVGNAIGAGESPRRAGMLGIVVGVIVMSGPALVFAFIPRPLMSLFASDENVIALGVSLLQIVSVLQLFTGVEVVAEGALRGGGDVRYAFGVNVIAYWVVGLPIALLLGFRFGWGARGLWCGITVALISVSAALMTRFLRRSRDSWRRLG